MTTVSLVKKVENLHKFVLTEELSSNDLNSLESLKHFDIVKSIEWNKYTKVLVIGIEN